MSKHHKHIEIQTKLHEVMACYRAGNNVAASIRLEDAMLDFFEFIANDRDTRICCQNWITELAHEFTEVPFIAITRSP